MIDGDAQDFLKFCGPKRARKQQLLPCDSRYVGLVRINLVSPVIITVIVVVDDDYH